MEKNFTEIQRCAPLTRAPQRTQGHKQQHQYKQQERILEFVQDVARHSRKNPHDNPAYDGINELTLEKEILVAVDAFRHHAAGGEHHKQADAQQHKEQRDQSPVVLTDRGALLRRTES